MAKPWIHAKSSARKYGGKPEDYIDIHNMMDSSKGLVPDVRHRALFHHAYGPFVMEHIFGVTRTNSANREYSVRDIAEQHILEDLGTIPTFQDYVRTMQMEKWMGGGKRKSQDKSKDEGHISEPVEVLYPNTNEKFFDTAKKQLDKLKNEREFDKFSLPTKPIFID
jgi:hypothetical protein